ncbi:hypothetical protein [Longimicrobium sp.]|uniref:hypothetical protein n=1 Tax=Longimicrobium sp. TaxID=2029185 RepID=UPI002E2FCA62|nr:hypothetical protein [Longimicrobium sp.]HEX6038868.1 hypothetical protein [Longimicrobium sp.]
MKFRSCAVAVALLLAGSLAQAGTCPVVAVASPDAEQPGTVYLTWEVSPFAPAGCDPLLEEQVWRVIRKDGSTTEVVVDEDYWHTQWVAPEPGWLYYATVFVVSSQPGQAATAGTYFRAHEEE